MKIVKLLTRVTEGETRHKPGETITVSDDRAESLARSMAATIIGEAAEPTPDPEPETQPEPDKAEEVKPKPETKPQPQRVGGKFAPKSK